MVGAILWSCAFLEIHSVRPIEREKEMTLDKTVARLAIQIANQYYTHYLEYRAEREEDYRNGYRPHYCEHGVNMWTDYDAICGYCEDGITMRDGLIRRRMALDVAKRRYEQAAELMAMWGQAQRLRVCTDDFERAVFDRVNTLLKVD